MSVIEMFKKDKNKDADTKSDINKDLLPQEVKTLNEYIKVRKISNLEKKIVKPATYKEVDTGSKREVDIIDKDGKRETKKIPIIERIFVDAVKEDVIVETLVYTYNDGIDNHDFSNEKDAKEFLKLNGKD